MTIEVQVINTVTDATAGTRSESGGILFLDTAAKLALVYGTQSGTPSAWDSDIFIQTVDYSTDTLAFGTRQIIAANAFVSSTQGSSPAGHHLTGTSKAVVGWREREDPADSASTRLKAVVVEHAGGGVLNIGTPIYLTSTPGGVGSWNDNPRPLALVADRVLFFQSQSSQLESYSVWDVSGLTLTKAYGGSPSPLDPYVWSTAAGSARIDDTRFIATPTGFDNVAYVAEIGASTVTWGPVLDLNPNGGTIVRDTGSEWLAGRRTSNTHIVDVITVSGTTASSAGTRTADTTTTSAGIGGWAKAGYVWTYDCDLREQSTWNMLHNGFVSTSAMPLGRNIIPVRNLDALALSYNTTGLNAAPRVRLLRIIGAGFQGILVDGHLL